MTSDFQGRPINAMPWEVRPCDNPIGWTTVGYIVPGPKCGTWVPCHHWHDRQTAETHAMLLNHGNSREDALEMVRTGMTERAALT